MICKLITRFLVLLICNCLLFPLFAQENAHWILADELLEKQAFQAALEQYESVIAQDPTSINKLSIKAISSFWTHRRKQLLRLSQKMRKAFPEHGDPLLFQAMLSHVYQNKPKRAWDYLQAAFRADPELLYANNQVAQQMSLEVLKSMKQPSSVWLDYLATLQAEQPGNIHINSCYAYYLIDTHPQKALKHYQLALQVQPELLLVHHKDIEQLFDKIDDALGFEDFVKGYIDQDPQNFEYWKILMNAAMEKQDYANVLSLSRACLERNPQYIRPVQVDVNRALQAAKSDVLWRAHLGWSGRNSLSHATWDWIFYSRFCKAKQWDKRAIAALDSALFYLSHDWRKTPKTVIWCAQMELLQKNKDSAKAVELLKNNYVEWVESTDRSCNPVKLLKEIYPKAKSNSSISSFIKKQLEQNPQKIFLWESLIKEAYQQQNFEKVLQLCYDCALANPNCLQKLNFYTEQSVYALKNQATYLQLGLETERLAPAWAAHQWLFLASCFNDIEAYESTLLAVRRARALPPSAGFTPHKLYFRELEALVQLQRYEVAFSLMLEQYPNFKKTAAPFEYFKKQLTYILNKTGNKSKILDFLNKLALRYPKDSMPNGLKSYFDAK